MNYVDWLATFRRCGFALNPQSSSLVMPDHTLTLGWHENRVSPYVAAQFWFDDKAPLATTTIAI